LSYIGIKRGCLLLLFLGGHSFELIQEVKNRGAREVRTNVVVALASRLNLPVAIAPEVIRFSHQIIVQIVY